MAATSDLWVERETKRIGHAIVDALAPTDPAAVVFTGDNRSPQDFVIHLEGGV